MFSPAHVPDPDRQCSVMCEISYPDRKQPPAGDPVRESLEGLRSLGLLGSDIVKVHSERAFRRYGYPVPTTDRDRILDEVLPFLEESAVLSRGRFGAWKYEVGNMDHSFMQGVEAANRLLRDEPETTWRNPNHVNAGKQ
jgi:hypothetical protein